jgi:hypothetical protein
VLGLNRVENDFVNGCENDVATHRVFRFGLKEIKNNRKENVFL